jgi:hypothetical protein
MCFIYYHASEICGIVPLDVFLGQALISRDDPTGEQSWTEGNSHMSPFE